MTKYDFLSAKEFCTTLESVETIVTKQKKNSSENEKYTQVRHHE